MLKLENIVLVVIMLSGMTNVATARDYNVEVVIFERIEDRTSENSQTSSIEAEGENSAISSSAEIDTVSNRMAAHIARINQLADASEEYETDPLLEHLRIINQNLSSSGYRVLKSARWTQPSEVFQNAPLVSLGVPDSSLPHAYIRVYRTSLIFADVDIQLSPSEDTLYLNTTSSISAQSGESGSGQHQQSSKYFLSEKRRLKFKEIHYFDNPKFGVILGVWPDNSSE